jgi:hypothetical protein
VSDWKDALAPSPECIDLARLGEELDAAERAHVETCTRCQSELALFRAVTSEESSAESQWIAEKLQRTAGETPALQPPGRRRSAYQVLYAIAAALVILIGAGTWLQLREASLDVPTGEGMYRSLHVEVVAPSGDLAQAPNEFRWKAVPDATRYDVRILEVDATQIWSRSTTETHVVLPPDVIARFAPGKTLLWSVEAYRGNESLASSETQNVRVTP